MPPGPFSRKLYFQLGDVVFCYHAPILTASAIPYLSSYYTKMYPLHHLFYLIIYYKFHLISTI